MHTVIFLAAALAALLRPIHAQGQSEETFEKEFEEEIEEVEEDIVNYWEEGFGQLLIACMFFFPALYVWNRDVYEKKPRLLMETEIVDMHGHPRLSVPPREHSATEAERNPDTHAARRTFVSTYVTSPSAKEYLQGDDFATPLLSCASETNSCVHGFVCPVLRLVDSYVTSGVVQRGVASMLSIVLFFLCMTCPPALLLYMPIMRNRVRRQIGGYDSCGLTDCIIANYCFSCHVCQMAQDVDAAVGVLTAAGCELVHLEERAVGIPVFVEDAGAIGAPATSPLLQ